MREINEFETWANSIVEAKSVTSNRLGTQVHGKADRPLQRQHDVAYKAQKAHPELSPENALALYVSDQLSDIEKMDYEQNKLINSQKRENEKLRRSLQSLNKELHDHEKQASQTDQEVERLKDLSAKLGPAGVETKAQAKASGDKIEAMLKDLENVRKNPSIDDKKFKEIADKVEKMKNFGDDKSIEKMQSTLQQLSKHANISDEMFDNAMNRLAKAEQELENKEIRFQKSKNRNDRQRAEWGTKFKDLNDKIESMDKKTSTADQKINALDKDTNELFKSYKDKIEKLTQYEKYLDNTVDNIEQAKNEINNNLELIRSIGKQDHAMDAISNAQNTSRQTVATNKHPQFEPDLEKELEPEPELEPELNLPIPDEHLAEDIKVHGNRYSLEEKEWLDTYLPKFMHLYQKLYPNDMGTIIDEEGLSQLVEDDMHLMYQYHAVISQKVVREKFEITHKKLVYAYKQRNANQLSLFATESLIQSYENGLTKLINLPY